VGIIWSGESSPWVALARMTNWPDDEPVSPYQPGSPADEAWLEAWWEDNEKNWAGPAPEFTIELCDGWMYSLYEAEFPLTEPADNIHVVIETSGAFYLDSVFVDAYWWTPPEAHGPTPGDGDVNVPLGTCKLIWYPGVDANEHNVYFSLDEAAVADACASALVSELQDVNFYPEGEGCLSLEPGKTYYWRVDEVNDPCLWPGAVWSFTMVPYILIDDFETYTDTAALLTVWKDWTGLPVEYQGAIAGLIGDLAFFLTEPYHSPTHAMNLEYDQSYGIPLVKRTYADPCDWWSGGLVTLALWFYGDANNLSNELSVPPEVDPCFASGMYVTLGDSDGDSATIAYDGDAGDLIAKEWIEWNIALQDFNDAGGVNPTDINSIAIGITDGTIGHIVFDDIRVYVRRCVPKYSWPFGDLGGPGGAPDCYIDEWDLDVMTENWLLGDLVVTSVEVSDDDPNLLVEYLFDPCASYDDLGNPWDSSGNNYHGSGINDVNIHAGMLTLLNTAEVNDFNTVDIPLDANTFNKPFSIVMKVSIEPGSVLFSVCPPSPNDPCEGSESYNSYDHAMTLFHSPQSEFGVDAVVRDHSWVAASGSITESGAADGEWHTVATTSDGNSGQITYLKAVP